MAVLSVRDAVSRYVMEIIPVAGILVPSYDVPKKRGDLFGCCGGACLRLSVPGAVQAREIRFCC